jgi:hypothetical protein
MKLPLLMQKRYLVIKALATLLALVFAFAYSRQLGVINRSILAFVFTLSSLIWVFLTSGTTLTLRKMRPEINSKEFASFQALILMQSAIGLITFSVALFLFSIFKTTIPLPLIFTSYLYFISSGFAMLFVEVAIAYFDFRFSGYLELLAVTVQIILYFILLTPASLSIAVKLTLSFVFSYLIISIIFLRRLKTRIKTLMRLASPSLFFRMTEGNHSLGISLGIMDRLDRLIIAFVFPTGILAKYSVMSSLISYFRFFPEFLSRVLISRNDSILFELRKHKWFLSFTVLFSGSAIILTAQTLIATFLGSSWVISIGILIAFGIQEIIRGAYQMTLNVNIKNGHAKSAKYVPWILVILVLPLSAISTRFLGLIGVPISFSLVFGMASIVGVRWRSHV